MWDCQIPPVLLVEQSMYTTYVILGISVAHWELDADSCDPSILRFHSPRLIRLYVEDSDIVASLSSQSNDANCD